MPSYTAIYLDHSLEMTFSMDEYLSVMNHLQLIRVFTP